MLDLLLSFLVFNSLRFNWFPTHSLPGFACIKTLKQDACLANRVTRHEATPCAFHQFGHLDSRSVDLAALCRVYNIDNCRWSGRLKVFDQLTDVASVGIWRVDALCAEIVKFLEVGVHDDFLLVGVLEWFGTRKWPISPGLNLHALTKSEEIASQDVHVHCLCNVVCIMTGQNLVGIDLHGTPVERLSSENSTEGAIIGQTDDLDDLVHGPPIQVLVRHDGQWQAISLLILLHSLK